VRLFVSISPPEDARVHLAATLLELAERVVRPEQWHVTLAFLGEVPEDAVPAVGDAVRKAAAGAKPLRLRLLGAGAFGRERAAVWVGLAGDLGRLERLARVVRGALLAAGIPAEDRPFTPHLTLARNVDLRQPAAAAALARLDSYEGPEWTAEQVVLMGSRLGAGPHGTALHTPVMSADLGG
jgi:2'-5' RNA ligase